MILLSSIGSFPLPLCPNLEATSVTHGRRVHCLRKCELFDLHQHLIPYDVAWSWQKNTQSRKRSYRLRRKEIAHTPLSFCNTLLFIHWVPLAPSTILDIKNPPFHVYRTERGGEVTFHGPGQLVMYPIINLRRHKRDLNWYLRILEEIVIPVLSSRFSIRASRLQGLTGVWVGNPKLAAIGIRVAHRITYHGLALNVTTDLAPFEWIIPCGIRDRQVGSIKGLLREARSCIVHGSPHLHDLDDARFIHITHGSLIEEFSQAFHLEYHYKTISVTLLREMIGSCLTKETRHG